MIATTENANSTTLEVVKQEKVPIEENFGKVYITQYESKSCLSNCISSLDNFDKKISQPLQKYEPNFFIEIIFLIFAKLFNTITVTLYLVFLLFYSIFFKKKFLYIYHSIYSCNNWCINHRNNKKNNWTRTSFINSEKIFL